MFCVQRNWRTIGWNRFCLEVQVEGEVAQTMYTRVSNDKILNNGFPNSCLMLK
jgi:hypothetical protein